MAHILSRYYEVNACMREAYDDSPNGLAGDVAVTQRQAHFQTYQKHILLFVPLLRRVARPVAGKHFRALETIPLRIHIIFTARWYSI